SAYKTPYILGTPLQSPNIYLVATYLERNKTPKLLRIKLVNIDIKINAVKILFYLIFYFLKRKSSSKTGV
ncbi:hypothetical protein X975_12427, partial [Stegodyphus mimosarum]